jgi:autotransporter translocation and assembly factor TamB
MSGPGNATLSGTADELRADMRGAGELDASRLTVARATIDNGGPGDVSLARVTDTLDAAMHGAGGLSATVEGKRVMLRMSGPGGVQLDGRAERISAQLSGSGSLQARRLTVRQSDINVRGPGNATVNQVSEGGGRDELVQVARGGRRQAD